MHNTARNIYKVNKIVLILLYYNTFENNIVYLNTRIRPKINCKYVMISSLISKIRCIILSMKSNIKNVLNI